MAKAKDEGEALDHMRLQHGRGHLSGQFTAWTQEKLRAVELAVEQLDPREDARPYVLDLGVGDLSVPQRWLDFTSGRVFYTGVDFVQAIVDQASVAYPGQEFVQASFSEVPTDPRLSGQAWDVVLLLDVLYHIPDPAVAQALQDWAFMASEGCVVVSYATNPAQVFDGGKKPGDAGFCWFPRPFVPPDPLAWTSIYTKDADTAQKQRLEVFKLNG